MKVLKEQPAGVGALLALVGAAVIMVYNVAAGQGPLDENVLAAGLAALYQLYTRYMVTPLARPQDRDGRALRPAQQDR